MKVIPKIYTFSTVIITALVFVVCTSGSVSAAQNSTHPNPSKCNASDWNIGLPDSTTCSGSVTIGASHSLNNDSKVQSIVGGNARVNPDLNSMNQLCKQYTGDSSSYATSGSVHNYCSGCDQRIASWTGSSWVVNTACSGTLNMQKIVCSTSCHPTTPTYCANGTTMTASEFATAKTAGKIAITQTSQSNQTTYHVSNTTGCSAPLIAASYKMFVEKPAAGWLSTQQFYADSGVVNINANGNTDVSVSLASCMTQPDLWYQTAPHSYTADDASGYSGYVLVYGGPISSGSVCTSCTPNASKKCVGNAVYWYDSCNVQGGLFQQCTANQTCANGACVDQTISCSTNSQCGTNAFTGSPFCQGSNVYQNYITYTCNNAGTSNSYCSNNTVAQLQTTCTGNQTCLNGSCVNNQSNLTVSCYATPNPVNINQSVSFICNVSGGTGNYTYSWSGACTSTSPVCTTSFANAGTQTAVALVTSGTQTNSASASVTINGSACTQNSYQRCSGNYLYWYDSCGNQQGNGIYCPNGCYNDSCSGYNNVSVQTNAATNVYSNQATLNGYLYNAGSNYNCNTYVWFQYGLTSSYGSETTHLSQSYSGSFSQIAYINSGSTYHFRAVAQDCSGNIVYGQDMTTYGSGTGGSLIVNKTVRNLSNSSGFSSSTSAVPGDMLMFMITLQNVGSQDVTNVVAKDYLPSNLIYNDQLVVACTTNNGNYNNYNYNNCNGSNYNYTGGISSGVYLNTIYTGQTVTITYQTQVANAANFAYGTTTLNNNVSITSSNGSNPTSNSSVIVNRTAVYGASVISTGLTNNFWVDSFFLPLLLALIGVWMWKSGVFFGIEKWIDNKKKMRKGYKAEKELAGRIAEIQKLERI